MTRKLSQPDRQAVDLVMDRIPQSDDGILVVDAAPSEPRVQAVEKILNMLGEMPVTEPPGDLVQKALRMIDQSAARPEERPTTPYIAPGQWPA